MDECAHDTFVKPLTLMKFYQESKCDQCPSHFHASSRTRRKLKDKHYRRLLLLLTCVATLFYPLLVCLFLLGLSYSAFVLFDKQLNVFFLSLIILIY